MLKLTQKSAKKGAIDTASAAVGVGIGGFAAKKIPSIMPQSDLLKKAAPFVPLVAGFLGSMMDNDVVRSISIGVASAGVLTGLAEFGKDANGLPATAGVKGFIAANVPTLSGVEEDLISAPPLRVDRSDFQSDFLLNGPGEGAGGDDIAQFLVSA